MRTPESQRTHEEKITRAEQGRKERAKLLGKPGPRHNTYMKLRREQFKEQSHAGKS
jgi:hypothetical protein